MRPILLQNCGGGGEKKEKERRRRKRNKERRGEKIEETVGKKRAARLSNYGLRDRFIRRAIRVISPIHLILFSSRFWFFFFFSLNDIAGNFLANNFNKAERRENSATAAKFVESSRGKPINSVLAHALRKYFISARSVGQRVPCIFRPARKQLSRCELACSSKLRVCDTRHVAEE